MLEPIRRPDLVDDVYAQLRNAILLGALAPGERLVEAQLATRLAVSRAPIRDALRTLERDGLVSPRGRRGKVVSTLSPHDAWEVYSFRATLEAMGIRLAIEKRSESLLAELEDLVVDMRKTAASGDLAKLSALDVRFHETICRASGHQRLFGAWKGMANQIRLLSQQVIDTQYRDLADIPDRHERLLAAIRSADSAVAEREVRSHIDSVAKRVVQTLSDRDEERERIVGDNGLELIGRVGEERRR
jgi:DNA-binding GntR family transcriptional regulator